MLLCRDTLHRGALCRDTLRRDILCWGALLGGTLLKVVAPYAYCAEYYPH